MLSMGGCVFKWQKYDVKQGMATMEIKEGLKGNCEGHDPGQRAGL